MSRQEAIRVVNERIVNLCDSMVDEGDSSEEDYESIVELIRERRVLMRRTVEELDIEIERLIGVQINHDRALRKTWNKDPEDYTVEEMIRIKQLKAVNEQIVGLTEKRTNRFEKLSQRGMLR